MANTPARGILSPNGGPMKVPFDCDAEDLIAAGMSCSDDAPCPIYLELSSVSAFGKRLAVAGNLHGPSPTLYSLLLVSDDSGATWKEPAARIPGAAIEQIQLFDATHAWAAGEVQVPLARDPFVLVTPDGGASWREKPLGEEGSAGAVHRFWFDSAEHGELIVDSGRTASAGRYLTYESHTGGENWNITAKAVQMPRLRREPPTTTFDYRLGTDSATRSFVIEKRTGGPSDSWTRVASFLVQIASCGTRHLPPDPDAPASDAASVK